MTKSNSYTLCVIMASHNRRNQTLACLDCLELAREKATAAEIRVILVEDGSSDGTEEAVRSRFPKVRIIQGDGNLFWNGAMRKGLGFAIEEGYDYYMLLNDDTLLAPDAIRRMVTAHQSLDDGRAIVVGTVVDPDTGEMTYGGRLRSSRWHPLRFEIGVRPDPLRALPCDTINGNCVLVPDLAVAAVGNLSPHFVHGGGDFDYGLRAKAEGIALLVAPGAVGTCVRDQSPAEPTPFRGGVIEDLWSFSTHPKKRPLRERIAYFRRHGGLLWWLLVPGPYVNRAAMHLRRDRRNRHVTK